MSSARLFLQFEAGLGPSTPSLDWQPPASKRPFRAQLRSAHDPLKPPKLPVPTCHPGLSEGLIRW